MMNCVFVSAALISGLKARQLPYSPYSIKRSLENSATYLQHVEPWAQGAGLVNIEKVPVPVLLLTLKKGTSKLNIN